MLIRLIIGVVNYFMRLIIFLYNIFYVVMKQPKSQTTMRSKLPKRTLFPTVRHSKQSAKLQEYEAIDKSAVYFNVNLFQFR